jgi:hypothetical protein
MNPDYQFRNRVTKVVLAGLLTLGVWVSSQAPSEGAEPPRDRTEQRYQRCLRQWARNPQGVTLGEARVECREQVRR